jgi:hypothetical protein
LSSKSSNRSGWLARIVAFDRRRTIAFVSVLAAFLGLGLFAGISIPFVGGAFFLLGLFIWYVPGALFAWTGFFQFHEFGASPTGVAGYLVMAFFYAALAAVVSWPLAPRRRQKGH